MRIFWLLVIAIMPFRCFADPFEEMLSLYEKYGQEKYMIQEEITQENHVRQAVHFAEVSGAPEEVIIGLLFHDIGQLAVKEFVGKLEILHPHHAEIGEKWLSERGFPDYICDWVRNHALAKIVLCLMYPEYYEKLSRASQVSYHYQKAKYEKALHSGRLDEFLRHRRREDFLAARKCDDLAKMVDFETPKLETYRKMTKRVLEGKGAPAVNEQWREVIEEMRVEGIL